MERENSSTHTNIDLNLFIYFSPHFDIRIDSEMFVRCLMNHELVAEDQLHQKYEKILDINKYFS